MHSKLPIALLSLFLVVSTNLHAQELLQNNDFANGIAPWTGDVKNAADLAGSDSDIPAGTKGMVIHLDPDHWTQASMDLDLTTRAVQASFVYSLVKGTKFTISESRIKDGAASLGLDLPPSMKLYPNMGLVASVSKEQPSRSYIFRIPGEGETSTPVIIQDFDCAEPPKKVTLVVAFPPGRGTVIITHASVRDRLFGMSGKTFQPANQASTAGGEEILQNADFSDGTTHWRGDCKPAGADATHDFVTNSKVLNGITVELHPATWTKVTQEFKHSMKGATITVEYTVSPDFKLTDNEKDYYNVGSAIGFDNAQLRPRPGSVLVMIDSPAPIQTTAQNVGGSLSVTVNPDTTMQLNLVPATEAGSHTYTQAVESNPMQPSAPFLKPIFCIAVPPGQGTITFTKVSIVAPARGFPGQFQRGYSAPGGYPGGNMTPQQPSTAPANQ